MVIIVVVLVRNATVESVEVLSVVMSLNVVVVFHNLSTVVLTVVVMVMVACVTMPRVVGVQMLSHRIGQ